MSSGSACRDCTPGKDSHRTRRVEGLKAAVDGRVRGVMHARGKKALDGLARRAICDEGPEAAQGVFVHGFAPALEVQASISLAAPLQ